MRSRQGSTLEITKTRALYRNYNTLRAGRSAHRENLASTSHTATALIKL